MWLYEELLQTAPKEGLRVKRNREIRKERASIEEQVNEEDRLLTVEEVKALRLKRQRKEGKDRWLIKEKQWQKEWNEKYWLDIGRTYVYLKEDFWAAIAETYHEIENELSILPDISMSENDLKDRDYILNHKYDWFYEWSWFGMSRYNGYIHKSNARGHRTIGSPIKLIPTQSLQQIYVNYIKAQSEVWKLLRKKAQERGMSVQGYVEWGFRYEDIIKGRRGYWRTRKATYKAREGSWLEKALKWIWIKYKNVALDYVRMIYEDKFMLTEACVPYNTYVVGDYVLFGSKACAVPSMFWNGEFFSEANRETIHHMARYALRNNPVYDIANKIPIFNGEDMRIIKVSSERIWPEDGQHNNGMYSYYLVPPTEKLWNLWNKDTTLEQAIARFKTPDISEMTPGTLSHKTTKEELKFIKRLPQNIFYLNTED